MDKSEKKERGKRRAKERGGRNKKDKLELENSIW